MADGPTGDQALETDADGLTFNPSTNNLTVAGGVEVGDDVKLTSDSSVISLGVGNDVTITHDGTTGS